MTKISSSVPTVPLASPVYGRDLLLLPWVVPGDVSQQAFAVGKTISFDYPILNRFGEPLHTRRRTMTITRIQDTQREPILWEAIEQAPKIRRGRWLVTGLDQELQAERSFYLDYLSRRFWRAGLYWADEPEQGFIERFETTFRPGNRALRYFREFHRWYAEWSQQEFGDQAIRVGIFTVDQSGTAAA
jgi:hypothetical protein